MSKSINPMLSFKPGTLPYTAAPRSHRLDEFAARLFLGGLLSSIARLRFADRFPSSGRRELSVNRFLRERFCTGLEGPDKANYQHPGWAKLDDRSGPSRMIELNFRKGIDSLAELCRQKLDADPFSGYLFVFRSRRATSIKVLVYDGQGFWLATKRLSKGRFRWWPRMKEGAEEPARVLRAHQAQVLLAAGNPDIDAAPVWRKVS